jgi:hypothetical protein
MGSGSKRRPRIQPPVTSSLFGLNILNTLFTNTLVKIVVACYISLIDLVTVFRLLLSWYTIESRMNLCIIGGVYEFLLKIIKSYKL